MASLRWEVLGCTPLPHRTEKSSDQEGEEPLSQAVSTQLLQPQVLQGTPPERASCQDSRNPVERAGAYLCALWATCPRSQLLRTSSMANGK